MFWREWDPIGINDAPGAEDEYDRYADKAYVMLMDEERTAEGIAAYLYNMSSERMGLGKSLLLKELAIDIVSKMVALKPTFELESNDPF